MGRFKSLVLLSVFALGATSSSVVGAEDGVDLLNKKNNSKTGTESLVNIGGVNNGCVTTSRNVESKLNDGLEKSEEKIIRQHEKNEASQKVNKKENDLVSTGDSGNGSKGELKDEAKSAKKSQNIVNAGKLGLFSIATGVSSAGIKKLVDYIKNGTKLKPNQSIEETDTDANIDHTKNQKTENKEPGKSAGNYIKIPVYVIISVVVLLILGFCVSELSFYIVRCKLKSKIIKVIPDIDQGRLTKKVLDTFLCRVDLLHYDPDGITLFKILTRKPDFLKNILNGKNVVNDILYLIRIFSYVECRNSKIAQDIMEALLGLDMDQIKILFDNEFINQSELIIKNNNAVDIINAVASVNRKEVTLLSNNKDNKDGERKERILSVLEQILSEKNAKALENILKKDSAGKIIESLLKSSPLYSNADIRVGIFFNSCLEKILNIDDEKLPSVIDALLNCKANNIRYLFGEEEYLKFVIAILFGEYGEKEELILKNVKTPLVTVKNNKKI